jgi:hypothetical protein
MFIQPRADVRLCWLWLCSFRGDKNDSSLSLIEKDTVAVPLLASWRAVRIMMQETDDETYCVKW